MVKEKICAVGRRRDSSTDRKYRDCAFKHRMRAAGRLTVSSGEGSAQSEDRGIHHALYGRFRDLSRSDPGHWLFPV